MSTAALKHNTYFDGNVQSVGFERNGRRATVGVIAPGSYHFGTEAPERMTVVSGALSVKPDGASAWSFYPAGTAFAYCYGHIQGLLDALARPTEA